MSSHAKDDQEACRTSPQQIPAGPESAPPRIVASCLSVHGLAPLQSRSCETPEPSHISNRGPGDHSPLRDALDRHIPLLLVQAVPSAPVPCHSGGRFPVQSAKHPDASDRCTRPRHCLYRGHNTNDLMEIPGSDPASPGIAFDRTMNRSNTSFRGTHANLRHSLDRPSCHTQGQLLVANSNSESEAGNRSSSRSTLPLESTFKSACLTQYRPW